MKKSIPLISFIALVFIFSFSCVSAKFKRLIHISTQEYTAETKIVLAFSESTEFKNMKLADSPYILIDFQKNHVHSSENNERIINKGPIKKIKTVYSRKDEGKTAKYVDFMLIELTKNLPYSVSWKDSSLIISVQNFEPASSAKIGENRYQEPENGTNGSESEEDFGYLIGPGDVLSIEVWRNPETSREVVVDFRGEITLPLIRRFKVTGLSVPIIEEKLAEALSFYLIDPIVFVKVVEYNSQRVTVLGETTPGMHTLKKKTTLLELLSKIGSPSENADTSKINVIKKSGEVILYDLESRLLDPQEHPPIFLEGGDTIYIPPLEQNNIYVLGEVDTPKPIEFHDHLNVVSAIAEAGGFSPNASKRSVIVIRGEIETQRGIRVDINQLVKSADLSQNIELEAGDIVYVPRNFISNVERWLRSMSTPILWWVSTWFLQ